MAWVIIVYVLPAPVAMVVDWLVAGGILRAPVATSVGPTVVASGGCPPSSWPDVMGVFIVGNELLIISRGLALVM